MIDSATPFLPYGRQLIGEDDIEAVAQVLRGDWLTSGPSIAAFENALASSVEARFAASCSSGTTALHLAAAALELGPGDHVVVPTLSFLATANAVRYVGAEVVFADVSADSGLMGVAELQSALEAAPRDAVKAVFPVHLNGQCADLAALSGLAREHGLKIVEDASHALGTCYGMASDQAKVGSCRHSDLTVFSFHPVKTVAMGEGGAVTTNDQALHQRLGRLRNHGMSKEAEQFANPDLAFAASGQANPWYYEMPELGFNYRASDIHCALALSQLKKLDDFVARRRRLVALYDDLLTPLAPLVRPVARVAGNQAAWHLYVVLIDFQALSGDRAWLMNALRERGIGSQVHYLPLHLQPYYRERYGETALPGAERYYAGALSLPLFPPWRRPTWNVWWPTWPI